MKIRNGFVSNSSSSSFIVINEGSQSKYTFKCDSAGNLHIDAHFGECEFGWGPEELYDVESKIVFSYLMARYFIFGEGQKYIDMLEKVIIENSNVKTISWEEDFGYIDHQSVESENLNMFESEDILKQFLFCNQSYIQLDHDNH